MSKNGILPSEAKLGYPGPYKAQWTEFEIQTIAYGILKKNLYPAYLVRGEYIFPRCRVDIAIFKSVKPEPLLLCVLEVKRTLRSNPYRQGTFYSSLLGVPCLYIRDGHEAYNVLEYVRPYLTPQII